MKGYVAPRLTEKPRYIGVFKDSGELCQGYSRQFFAGPIKRKELAYLIVVKRHVK